MSMVKRVAQAIGDAWVEEPDGAEMLIVARAAIAEMEVATAEMIGAGLDNEHYGCVMVWTAMARAALKED